QVCQLLSGLRFLDSLARPSAPSLEPEPDVMPLPLGLGMVPEGAAVVKEPAIVDEEHVTRPETKFHPEVWVAKHLIQDLPGSHLGRRQRLPGFLVAGLDPVAEIAARQFTAVPVENRELGGGRLARP